MSEAILSKENATKEYVNLAVALADGEISPENVDIDERAAQIIAKMQFCKLSWRKDGGDVRITYKLSSPIKDEKGQLLREVTFTDPPRRIAKMHKINLSALQSLDIDSEAPKLLACYTGHDPSIFEDVKNKEYVFLALLGLLFL